MTIQISGIVRDRSIVNTEIELIGDVQMGGNVLFGEKTVINGNGYKIESFGELKFEGGEWEKNENIINYATIGYSDSAFEINGYTIKN